MRSWAEPMDTEGDVVNGATRGQPVLYTVVAAGGFRGVPSPLAEAPIGPGHWAYANRPGPALYAVPRPGDGYEWAPWEEACRRGWSGRSGRCEYWGPELARRFIVLYVPAGRRAWWQRWRPSRPRPVRLGRFGNEGEARLRAEQVLPRRQLGFWWPLAMGSVQGWDDRAIGYHGDCWVDCGCAAPQPGREHVLVLELPDEETARRPHVGLEREAWMEQLTIQLAVALSGCPEAGRCQPTCVHCSAPYEEVAAAWEWLRAHRRQVRAFERAARRRALRAQPEAPRW